MFKKYLGVTSALILFAIALTVNAGGGAGVVQVGTIVAGHLAVWAGVNQIDDGGAVPASGVVSLNSLSGALNITAGSNITVTPSGSSIQIASSASGGVSSLNSLTGGLSLTSTGSSVTITPSGSTIDLEASSGVSYVAGSGIATASGTNTFAGGGSATASGTDSTTVGQLSNAAGNFTTAFGETAGSSNSAYTNWVAIGQGAGIGGSNSVVIGRSAGGLVNSVSIGEAAVPSANSEILIGANTTGQGAEDVVIGNAATTTGSSVLSTVVGEGSTSSGSHSVICGAADTISNNGSVILGYNQTDAEANDIIMGNATWFIKLNGTTGAITSNGSFPASSLASGAYASRPGSPTAGQEYYATDLGTGVLIIYNGTKWKPVTGSAVLASTGVGATTTSTTETNLTIVTLPAGLLSTTGSLRISMLINYAGVSGVGTVRVRWSSTSGDTTGGSTVSVAANTAGAAGAASTIALASNLNSLSAQETDIFYSDNLPSSNFFVNSPAINTASISYLNFNAQAPSGGHATGYYSYVVEWIEG